MSKIAELLKKCGTATVPSDVVQVPFHVLKRSMRYATTLITEKLECLHFVKNQTKYSKQQIVDFREQYLESEEKVLKDPQIALALFRDLLDQYLVEMLDDDDRNKLSKCADIKDDCARILETKNFLLAFYGDYARCFYDLFFFLNDVKDRSKGEANESNAIQIGEFYANNFSKIIKRSSVVVKKFVACLVEDYFIYFPPRSFKTDINIDLRTSQKLFDDAYNVLYKNAQTPYTLIKSANAKQVYEFIQAYIRNEKSCKFDHMILVANVFKNTLSYLFKHLIPYSLNKNMQLLILASEQEKVVKLQELYRKFSTECKIYLQKLFLMLLFVSKQLANSQQQEMMTQVVRQLSVRFLRNIPLEYDHAYVVGGIMSVFIDLSLNYFTLVFPQEF